MKDINKLLKADLIMTITIITRDTLHWSELNMNISSICVQVQL